jgi:hypothetical protein
LFNIFKKELNISDLVSPKIPISDQNNDKWMNTNILRKVKVLS